MTDKNDELNEAYNAFETGNYVLAKALFEQLVPQNYRAHLYLGWMYDQGLGVNENSKQAEHHYRCLSNANDADGKYYLASLLQRKNDLANAVALYEEAADLNHVSSAYWAYALRSGDPVSLADKNKADFYLKKAARFGHVFAQRDLARQEMKTNTGALRMFAKFRYYFLKFKSIILIIRNSQDMRVR